MLAQLRLHSYSRSFRAVVRFGLRARPVRREIPFDALRLLRASSSLRLKNGYAQDDKVV